MSSCRRWSPEMEPRMKSLEDKQVLKTQSLKDDPFGFSEWPWAHLQVISCAQLGDRCPPCGSIDFDCHQVGGLEAGRSSETLGVGPKSVFVKGFDHRKLGESNLWIEKNGHFQKMVDKINDNFVGLQFFLRIHHEINWGWTSRWWTAGNRRLLWSRLGYLNSPVMGSKLSMVFPSGLVKSIICLFLFKEEHVGNKQILAIKSLPKNLVRCGFQVRKQPTRKSTRNMTSLEVKSSGRGRGHIGGDADFFGRVFVGKNLAKKWQLISTHGFFATGFENWYDKSRCRWWFLAIVQIQQPIDCNNECQCS